MKQINLAVVQYAGDNNDSLPATANTDAHEGTNAFADFYKPMVMRYLGLSGPASPLDKVFACPADTFFYSNLDLITVSAHGLADNSYSSYAYNGLGGTTNAPSMVPDQTTLPGLFGWKLGAIHEPGKTVLVAELPALWPYSWHDSLRIPAGQGGVNNARDMVSFADGHVSFIKMYSNTNYLVVTCYYDPPAGYEYKWSGE